MINPQKDTIGFIGIGVMGASMAGHLLAAGYTVLVYTRTRAKAEGLIAKGAVWCESVQALAAGASCVITMVGYPRDVEEVYFGPAGLLENLKPGAMAIDTTTSKPELARRIAAAAEVRGIKALDAPVSGGDLGARNATLTIMVGGSKAAYEEALPLFQVMGKTTVLQGGPGAGQHTKMANQIAIAGSLIGAVESLAYAKAAGLYPTTVLSSIGAGSAGSWQLNNLGPKMIAGDYAPGFYSKHILKDLGIALEAAREMHLDLPILSAAERFFKAVCDAGWGEKGTQVLAQLYSEGLAAKALQ